MLGWTKGGQARLVKTVSASGRALEGRLGEDVLGDGDGEALKVGLEMRSARGAHLGLWNVRGNDGVATSAIDQVDVRDALGFGGDNGSSKYIVAFEGQVVKTDVSNVAPARLLGEPLLSVRLQPRGFAIATVAQVFSLPVTGLGAALEKASSVEIACLGLMDKHTGLAAVGSVSVVDSKTAPARKDSVQTATAINGHSKKVPMSPPPSYSSLARRNGSSVGPRSFPRPHPQSRLALLLYYLTTRVATSASSTSAHGSYEHPGTFHLQLRPLVSSLTSDLVARPISTTLFESRALVGFALAVVFWSLGKATDVLGSLRNRAGRTRVGGAGGESGPSTPVVENKSLASPAGAQVESELGGDARKHDGSALRVELLAVSTQLGFWVEARSGGGGGGFEHDCPIKFEMDGKAVHAKHVKCRKQGGDGWTVSVDVEAVAHELKHQSVNGPLGDKAWELYAFC